MKNYNKLPFKERQRHLKYNFEQTERQEKRLLELEMQRYEAEVCQAKQGMTDKEMQAQEVFDMFQKFAKEMGCGE